MSQKFTINNVDGLLMILKSPDRTYHDFAVMLNGGLYSKKEIALNEDGTIFILNGIDGTTQNLTPDELFDRELTNIGYAIENGGFYHLIY